MLAETYRPDRADRTPAQRVLDDLVPDPTGRIPMCDPATFPVLLDDWVTDSAPSLFAVVLGYGDRVDTHIAAWGVAFAERVDVLGVDGTIHRGLRHAVDALPLLCIGNHVTAHLVWVDVDGTAQETAISAPVNGSLEDRSDG